MCRPGDDAVHQQCGSVWAYLPQQSMLHEQPQILVDGCQRNGRSSPSDLCINRFSGVVPRRGHDGFIDHLPLVRRSQSTLPNQVPELFVSGSRGRSHVLDKNHYNPRIIHKETNETALCSSLRGRRECWNPNVKFLFWANSAVQNVRGITVASCLEEYHRLASKRIRSRAGVCR